MNNFKMEETLQEKGRRLQKQRDYIIDVDKYILVHVDGRSFSKNIKNKYEKPFDRNFIDMMNKTAAYLCENVQGAKIAYVQSDEITLLLKKDTPEGDIFFGGRLCKMQSIIASLATAKFNQLALFRNIDCIRNSKQQFAQTYLSHKELMNRNTDEQVDMCTQEKGKDWHLCRADEKYGRIIAKEEIEFENEGGEKYTRSRWLPHDGVDLTDVETRNNFIEKYNFFK